MDYIFIKSRLQIRQYNSNDNEMSQSESNNDGQVNSQSSNSNISDYSDEVPSENDNLNSSSEDSRESIQEKENEGSRLVEDVRILQKILKESNRKPVPKEERCTLNIISKYEYAKVIGMRANQIACNSPLYIDVPQEELKGYSAIQIAERQFREKKLPFIIRRPLPNGTYEDWSLSELENKNI